MFNGLWCYRYLLWNLVSRDFKLKYRRSVLGVVWSVLNPLLMCLVYWAVFSSLMDMRGSGIDNFPATTQTTEASRCGLEQMRHVSVSDILWHTLQYFTSCFSVTMALPNASTTAVSWRSR